MVNWDTPDAKRVLLSLQCISSRDNACNACNEVCWPKLVTIFSNDDGFAAFCGEGYVSDTGVYPCSPCPVNHYSFNNTHCEMCPSGTKGRSNAQSSSDSCKRKCLSQSCVPYLYIHSHTCTYDHIPVHTLNYLYIHSPTCTYIHSPTCTYIHLPVYTLT